MPNMMANVAIKTTNRLEFLQLEQLHLNDTKARFYVESVSLTFTNKQQEFHLDIQHPNSQFYKEVTTP